MDPSFAHLEDISTKLNTVSDTVSEYLKRVEAKLATLRLGVEVWLEEKPLTIEPELDEKGELMYTEETYLGYAKVDGAWHLAFNSNYGRIMNYPNPDRPSPIQQAPRELRIAALKRIPDLIAALEKKGEDELYKIELALDSVAVLTARKGIADPEL